MFFFEKKNQKTFAHLQPPAVKQLHFCRQQRQSKSFWFLF